MRFVPAACAVVVTLLTSGCFSMLPTPEPPAELTAAAPGGKGIVLVRPPSSGDKCKVVVEGEEGKQHTTCNTEYLLSCDASRPESEPFCKVMRESGPVRDSHYPKEAR